jgi:hypothetical protein
MRDKRRVCMRCAERKRTPIPCRVCGAGCCGHLSTGWMYEDSGSKFTGIFGGIHKVTSVVCGPCKHSGAAARWWAEQRDQKKDS